jgi:hypothetical protein
MTNASPVDVRAAQTQSRRPPVLNHLQSKSDRELLIIFQNCIRALTKGPNEDARQVIGGIELEWQRRAETVSLDPRPAEGMLAALGYHVGINGEKMAVRRRILKHVLEGELPLVGSAAYTAEWGKPLTRARLDKLTRFFYGMLESAQNNRDRPI